jgi:hypothetical protein
LPAELDTAAAVLRRTLPISRDLGHTSVVAEGAAVVALIAASEGDNATAAVLTSAARHLLDAVGVVGSRPANICLEDAEALMADPPEDLSEARAAGAQMTVEETVNHALTVLDQYGPTEVNG